MAVPISPLMLASVAQPPQSQVQDLNAPTDHYLNPQESFRSLTGVSRTALGLNFSIDPPPDNTWFNTPSWMNIPILIGQGLLIAVAFGIITRPLWDAPLLMFLIQRAFRCNNPQLLGSPKSFELLRGAYKNYGGFYSVYNFAAEYRNDKEKASETLIKEFETLLKQRLEFLHKATHRQIDAKYLESCLLDDLKDDWEKFQALGWEVRFGEMAHCFPEERVIQLPRRLGPEDPRILFSRMIYTLRLHDISRFHRSFIRFKLKQALQPIETDIGFNEHIFHKSLSFLIDREAYMVSLDQYQTLCESEPAIRTAEMEILVAAGDKAQGILHQQLAGKHILPIALRDQLKEVSWTDLVPPIKCK